MMKKLTALFVAVAAALSLTACSNSESDDLGSGIHTVQNKNASIGIFGKKYDTVYCGEWADGKANGEGYCFYSRYDDAIAICSGSFQDGDITTFGELTYIKGGDYEFRKGAAAYAFVNRTYTEYFQSVDSEFEFYRYIYDPELGKSEEYEYYLSDGVITTDFEHKQMLTGEEAENVVKEMEDHFGFTDDFNRLRSLLDNYIKENNIDFVIPTMPSVRDYWDNSNDTGDYGNSADS